MKIEHMAMYVNNLEAARVFCEISWRQVKRRLSQ